MESLVQNPLYPVFFRMDKLRMLIVGAGEVGGEKLRFILKSSPNVRIRLVAPEALEECSDYIAQFPKNINWVQRCVAEEDVINADLVVAATNIKTVNQQVYRWAKQHGKIVNVADTPDLCDFYMGSIISKGDLKIAISTNGKSPTLAKRIRQVLEEVIPNNVGQTLNHLVTIRSRLKGDFEHKVKELNKITASIVNNIAS